MSPDPLPAADELERIVDRLDRAEAALAELPGDQQTFAHDYADALADLHRVALTAIVTRLKDDPRGGELLQQLADDPGVRMVLTMHGILRPDTATAVQIVLTQMRPALAAQGVEVELDRLVDGVAHLRLRATGADPERMPEAVAQLEEVLRIGVPGLQGVELTAGEPYPGFVPIDSLQVRTGIPAPAAGRSHGSAPEPPRSGAAGLAAEGWVPSLAVRSLPDGGLRSVAVPGALGLLEVVLVGLPDGPRAYADACPLGQPFPGETEAAGETEATGETEAAGAGLAAASLDPAAGVLICPCHGVEFDARDGSSGAGVALQPVPVRVERDRLWLHLGRQ